MIKTKNSSVKIHEENILKRVNQFNHVEAQVHTDI